MLHVNVDVERESAERTPLFDGPPMTDAVRFSTGHPLVQVVEGEVSLVRDAPGRRSPAAVREALRRSTVACIMAVPTRMSVRELLSFVGPDLPHVRQMRVLRDEIPYRYVVLVQFGSNEQAAAFVARCNGIPFNSMEPEKCHAQLVDRVAFHKADTLRDAAAAAVTAAGGPVEPGPQPLALADAAQSGSLVVTAAPSAAEAGQPGASARAGSAPVADASDQSAPAAPAPAPADLDAAADHGAAAAAEAAQAMASVVPGDDPPSAQPSPPWATPLHCHFPLPEDAIRELPKCPVCLERLNADVTGMLTTVCNHTFHCDCLSRWQDSTCPVCRHCAHAEPDDLQCEDCAARANLWMCLVCGAVGCGRYEHGHMRQHYARTGHAYCIHVETQRVWDYAGDEYVHRLVLNRVDGKVVELPDPGPSAGAYRGGEGAGSAVARAEGASYSDEARKDKLQSLALEYEYLLVSQLETQKEWFESRLAQAAQVASQAQARAAEAVEAAEDADRRLKASQRQLQQRQARVEKLEGEVGFLRELNATLLRDQQGSRRLIEAAQREGEEGKRALAARVAELEEQLADVMRHLEMQARVESSPLKDEIQAGVTLVTEDESSRASAARARRARRKGK